MSLHRRMVCVSRVLLWALVFGLASGAILAQNASLSGIVTDPQGGVVPGAEVTLLNPATGTSRLAVTDNEGRYTFPQVAPGTYQVRAALTGFKTKAVTGVQLLVDTAKRVDLQLELGAVSEVITVSSATEAVLNTVDASIGNAFNEEQIVDLPLNSRNVYNLLSLQPGVISTGEVSGARRDQSNLTLDGVDVNDQQDGTAFTPVLRVTPDSVQEFRVTVSNPNAGQGRSSGAQVSLVTKGGTNDWHGSLYEFHRNTVTSANDFFNNRAGVPRPNLIRNLFGGSLGGPIVKDRAFFFFNYEGRKDRSQDNTVRTVPFPHLGQGIIKYRDASGNPTQVGPSEIASLYPEVGGVNPVALAALADAAARYPMNDNGVGDGVNISGFRFNGSTPLDQNTYIARLDFNLADNQQLFVRGNYQWDHQGFLGRYPDTPAPSLWQHPGGIAIGHTWTVTPNFINTFRYGLTRESFSNQGDSSDNAINFRFIYQPRSFSRTLSRTTPVHNFVNDTSWIKGTHTFQFGTNIRVIKNNRLSYANSYDSAVANPSFYAGSGGVLDIPNVLSGDRDVYRNAITTVLGRYSQFAGRFIFDVDGTLLDPGSPADRSFATEEYELYFADTWQMAPSLTVNLGLRWGVNTPVYETSGFEVAPTRPLAEFFELRKQGALNGVPFNELVTIDTAGPYYGKPGFYPTDKNNWSPRVSAAWSPSFQGGIGKFLFGDHGQTVIRGGFSTTYDRIGSALAVQFDLNNTLGFSSEQSISANTFDVSSNPGPRFTGFDQAIRPLLEPNGLSVPTSLVFPLTHPADESTRIERALDSALTTPYHFTFNLSYGRELPGGLFVEGSYLRRRAHDLLGDHDVMQQNNFVDPLSGQDWYSAAKQLALARINDTPIEGIAPIPFFENLFPNAFSSRFGTPTQRIYSLVSQEGNNIGDWTYLQDILDDRGIIPNMFFHPQYGALDVLSTIVPAEYDAFTVTARERFKDSLTFDINYTWSKSFDYASGGGGDSGTSYAAILNALSPEQSRAVSNFDHTHIINSNWLWRLPFGHGHSLGSSWSGAADAVLGGWSLNGIFRWNSGRAHDGPFEASRWATNWNASSNAVRLRDPHFNPQKNSGNGGPGVFSDTLYSYQSFRDAFAGEAGDRNPFRRQGFVSFDFGLQKAFAMPYNENHQLEFRWEVFNATNTQRLGSVAGGRSGYGTSPLPQFGTPSSSFGNITSIQGSPRVMQFGLRYQF